MEKMKKDLRRELEQIYELFMNSVSIDQTLENLDPILLEDIKVSSLIYELLSDEELELLIRIHLLIYDQSETGKVIITDSKYDALSKEYKRRTNKSITTVEVNQTTSRKWDMVKHPYPNLVGSISKVYTKEELYKWLEQFDHYPDGITIGMKLKYDGISSAIVYNGNDRYLAITRKDGVVGQDITILIENIPAIKRGDLEFLRHCNRVKTEILMTRDDFEDLQKEYPNLYMNRRSAVSGIVNTPSNLHLAKYLTVKPLVSNAYNTDEYYPCKLDKRIQYNPNCKGDVYYDVLELVKEGKSTDNLFRVDGVVLYPIDIHGSIIGKVDDDVLESCVAFKTNSAFGITRALEVYPSVGRTGQVTPMLKVEPVEVNETIVTDVSLSTLKKFLNLKLYHMEKVEIESAGDVIPMVKGTLNPKEYPEDSTVLKMKMRCPHCGGEFELKGELLFCMNKSCPRVQAGILTNFLTKIGINGIKDATVETLQDQGYMLTIKDIFDFIYSRDQQKEVSKLPGFNSKSVENMVEELDRLTTEEFTYSKLIGSLGIQDVSISTARLILSKIPYNTCMKSSREELRDLLLEIKGIGEVLANAFSTYIEENKELIQYLDRHMKLIPDMIELGKVVFTGFDNEVLRARFEEKGYLVKDNLTSDTTYLVAASTTTGKYKKAIVKGIPVYMLNDVEELLAKL